MALIANYAMHNVALSYQNRLISSDVAGIAAEHARLSLAGSPVVLLTNGACANTVPPEVSPDPRIMIGFGKMIGEKIVGSAQNSKSFSSPVLCTLIEDIELPLTRLSNDDILLEHDRETTRYAGKPNWLSAIKAWKDDTLSLLAKAPPNCINAVLHVIRIGPFTFTAISAEVFSRLADELRSVGGAGNYVVGYANGNVGYLPFREIYDEGGYEVTTAYKFYSNFMVSVGGYERVRDWAIILLGALHEGNIALEDPSGQLSA